MSAVAGTGADWARDAVFYHVYPLGMLGAPERNDFVSPPEPRLARLEAWIPHLRALGITALYLGPVLESTAHGYDTADYLAVDRRLGDEETLRHLVGALHAAGIRVVLDAVLNHAGREFGPFRDVRERGAGSRYAGWFDGLRFDGRSPYGDPFTYRGWAGNYDLVKLDTGNAEVRAHLFGAVERWLTDWDVDGLRLDAADCLDLGFLRDLAAFVRARRPDAWLMGEVVHGDYRRWANPETLDSVTNYECAKGLWSSLADRNYFEIAYGLRRQFGEDGIYRGLPLYAFVDNHDVDRAAGLLPRRELLWPLYGLLFTMPGVPSVYYGSEWGLDGRRTRTDDRALRPALEPEDGPRRGIAPGLAPFIARLARVRAASAPLRRGDYLQLHVAHEQLAFARRLDGDAVVVLLNAADHAAAFDVPAPAESATWVDLLPPGDWATGTGDDPAEEWASDPAAQAALHVGDGRLAAEVAPASLRILAARRPA